MMRLFSFVWSPDVICSSNQLGFCMPAFNLDTSNQLWFRVLAFNLEKKSGIVSMDRKAEASTSELRYSAVVKVARLSTC